MTKLLKKLRKNEEGATAIEYGLIAALIAVVIIGALGSVGESLSSKFSLIAGKVSSAGN